MSFPLHDLNEFDPRKPRPDNKPKPDDPGAACPSDGPVAPTTYLRDLLVILIVAAVLAGILLLAYYVPKWI